MIPNVRAPRAITPEVRFFCKAIDPSEEPLFVRCDTSPSAVPQHCFDNVAATVAARGGDSQHGWKIREWPGVYLEAEFHAVWRRPDGTLIDVSPSDDDPILFHLDSKRIYDGVRVPNILRALSGDETVLDFINSCKELWEYEAARWDDSRCLVDIETDRERIVHFHLQRRRVVNQYNLWHHLGLLANPNHAAMIRLLLSRAPSALIAEITAKNDW